MLFKRNQVEEAISGVLKTQSRKPSSGLRTRLKRLLDTDRALGRALRSKDPELANYAFYSNEAPGSGVEVWFSEYEAFALLIALHLMGHGWPQSFVVSLMRRVRPEMEAQHSRILKQNPTWLFDQEEIRRNARAGDMAFDNRDPVLLTIVSKSAATTNEQQEVYDFAVYRGPRDAMRFAWGASGGRGALTMFELATLAHQFSHALAQTLPRSRGRGG